jgi:leucyl aminopeptidase
MFRFNVRSADQKIIYKTSSLAVKFLIEEKKFKENLNSIERIFNVKISELQKNTFLKEGKQIRLNKYDGKPDEILILKVKINNSFTPDYFRNAMAGLIQDIYQEEIRYLHIFLPKYDTFKNYFPTEEYYNQTFVEGLFYGNYSFDNYKSEKSKEKDLDIFLHAEDEVKLHYGLKTSLKVMEGVNFARDLQNEPGSALTPEILADTISDKLSLKGISIKVFDEKEIKRRKMGGLFSVGQGSDNPPRFIVINYSPAKKVKKLKRVVLVGKGVTFDSGGISIKPSQDMGEMKADMSGAAVVAGVILAAAKSNLAIEITGIIPAAENLLSGSSYRPGDIITTASGKTVEVENTDAEGRLILADALDYACRQKPDYIIDLATLTGAVVVALGSITAGLFTKNNYLKDTIYNSGLKTFERVWQLPLWDEYYEFIKSDVADIKNLGGKWGGAITAAKFLEHFIDKDIPWAHLDIAGPTYPNKTRNYNKKYMTGYGVRLIYEVLNRIRTD